ncbi:hypothetical protein ACFXPA_24400 [Amycolatopsis sp. NPDC059090]|uniref:hypothetical protein n=1 Tax=unclassified Amycolatopsis TaxID=2618356 RepID=UPI00366FF318
MAGEVQRCLSAHQASHEPTAARLQFQVAAAAEPHSADSDASISSSATSSSGRSGPSSAAVRSSTPV